MTGRYNTHFRNTYKVMRYKVKIESWMWSTDLLVHHAMMASSMQQYFSRASYKSTTTSSSRAYPLNRISKSMDWGCSFCYTTSWLIRSSAFRYNTDLACNPMYAIVMSRRLEKLICIIVLIRCIELYPLFIPIMIRLSFWLFPSCWCMCHVEACR